MDVICANKQVQSVITTLKNMRENSSTEFKNIFSETCELGKELHGQEFELNRPRIVQRQVHRSNPELSNTEDFFVSHYIMSFYLM